MTDKERIRALEVTYEAIKKNTKRILSILENGVATKVADQERWQDNHDKKTKRRQQIYDRVWAAIVIWLLIGEAGLREFITKWIMGL